MLRDVADSQILLEPQAQIIYTNYSADSVRDASGATMRTEDNGGITTRLGARLFGRNKTAEGRLWQPFVEANWWHSSTTDSMYFGTDNGWGSTQSQDTPKNRFEVKAGVQVEIAKRWNLWGQIGYQFGDNSYSRIEGLAGVKYLW